ncbi:flagellar biosynthesis repressor FlbT [Marinibaculum pumilum]|uniref:Flagellar biosynthesis repressor FlbT n=1 Tax=Marinibaculum pumilum TaxID=1766165 RepID=A0ABV7L462_9PROT
MPLKINLKPNEKIIINGCVLESVGASANLVVHNEALLMREKDIMTETEAATPARRIYYAIQCAYLFEANRDRYLAQFDELTSQFEEAVPSARQLTGEFRQSVAEGRFYKALRQARELIDREQEILDGIHERGISTDGLFKNPAGGESASDRRLGPDGGGKTPARGQKQRQARAV